MKLNHFFPSIMITGLQTVAALCLFGLVLIVGAGSLPALLGYESFVVYSGSMEPEIGVGDLAVVSPVPSEELRVGDVITYRPAGRPDVLVTHRLLRISEDEQGRLTFETKGDANATADQIAVVPEAVLGRVSYSIPQLGYIVDFAKRPMGRLALIGVPALLLALDYLLASSRKRFSSTVQPAEELIERGRLAMEKGALNVAIELFDQAIALDPWIEEAWILKAECLHGLDATNCLRAGLAVNPTSVTLSRALERVTPSTTQRTI